MSNQVIAVAYPNRRYVFFESIQHVRLEARIKGSGVHFYSIEDDKEKHITEDLAKSLLPTDVKIKRRPFNYKDNLKFWVVLNRKSKKYKEKYNELLKSTGHDTTKHDSSNKDRPDKRKENGRKRKRRTRRR
jgi:hypothetical protein